MKKDKDRVETEAGDEIFEKLLAEALIPGGAPEEERSRAELLAIRTRYQSFRTQSMLVNHQVLVKRVIGPRLEQAQKKLHLGSRKKVVLGSEAELPILMDFAIHCVLRNGRNLVDECVADGGAAISAKNLEVLRVFQAAHYAVLKVEKIEPEYGLYCADWSVYPPIRIFLADRNLSLTAASRGFVATRVLSLDNFFLTAGAGIFVHRDLEDAFLLKFLSHLEAKLRRRPEGWRAVTREEDVALAGLLVPFLLRHEASSHIAFRRGEETPVEELLDL